MAGKSNRLQVLQTTKDDPSCVTFILQEDHTLGNALRYVIMKYPEVQFCGYTAPHPLEPKIHFRIQTYGSPAYDVLKKGLKDLKQLCAHVLSTFEDTITVYKEQTTTGENKMEM